MKDKNNTKYNDSKNGEHFWACGISFKIWLYLERTSPSNQDEWQDNCPLSITLDLKWVFTILG